jgi:hypothetical protein
MSQDCNGQSSDKDREHRIAELRRQIEEKAGEKPIWWESTALSDGLREEFLRQVLECENGGPTTTNFQELTEAGVQLPPPDAIGDEQLTSRLWEVICVLARMRVFLSSTDHLSDRELYTRLWSQELREETESSAACPETVWHVDLVANDSETDRQLYLKHCADEDTRRQWLVGFPDYPMPAHEDPPYQRDRKLPRPVYVRHWTSTPRQSEVES